MRSTTAVAVVRRDGLGRVMEMAETTRLPSPVIESWDWQRHAACRGMDVAAFFHPYGERGEPWRERERRAKQVCQGCPVRQECLDHSLAVEEPFGTWGGLGERERWEIVQRRRRAARPADRTGPLPEQPVVIPQLRAASGQVDRSRTSPPRRRGPRV